MDDDKKVEEPAEETESAEVEEETKPAEEVKAPEKATEEAETTPAEKEAVPATPVAAASTAPSKPKKWLFAIIVIALILIVGGGAGAYFGVIQPNQPKNVVKKALSKVLVLNQSRSFNLTADFTNKSTSSSTLKGFSLTGGMDNNSNIRADVTVDSGDININASAIVRLDDQKAYFKLSNLDSLFSSIPNATDYPEIAAFVNGLSNKWIRLSVADLQDAGFINAAAAEKADTCITAVTGFVKNSSADLQNQFNTLYDKADFASMTKIGSDVVDGKKMTKYAVAIDKTKFKAFLTTLSNQLQGSTKQVADKCGFDSSTANSDSSSVASNAVLKNVYLWIDSNKQIGKLSVEVDDVDTSVTIAATMTNETVDTTKPSDYTTLSELLKDSSISTLLESMIGSFTGSN